MRMFEITVDGKQFNCISFAVHKRDSRRINELLAKGFWAGVESGDIISMLTVLGPADD